MSIRPVDYQILMPKVNEAAKIQNAEQHKVLGQAQQQAETSTKQADHDTKSVHSQKEAQKTVITEKQKERSKKQGRQKNDESDEKNGDKEQSLSRKTPQERRTIDIRL